jgi:hypothetical protein
LTVPPKLDYYYPDSPLGNSFIGLFVLDILSLEPNRQPADAVDGASGGLFEAAAVG